jgi:hypothetical protein
VPRFFELLVAARVCGGKYLGRHYIRNDALDVPPAPGTKRQKKAAGVGMKSINRSTARNVARMVKHLSIGRWDAGRAILMRSCDAFEELRTRRRRRTHLFGLPRIMAEPGKVPGSKVARPRLQTLFGTSPIIKSLQRNDAQMRKFI